MDEHSMPDPDTVARDCVNTIKAHHLKNRMDALKKEIAEAERGGKAGAVSDLHKEFKQTNEAYRSLSAQ